MPWHEAEKRLDDLPTFLYEQHAHTAQLTQAVLATVPGRKGALPGVADLLLSFAMPFMQDKAQPIPQAAARDFLAATRRGLVPGWVIALTSQNNLLARIKAAGTPRATRARLVASAGLRAYSPPTRPP